MRIGLGQMNLTEFKRLASKGTMKLELVEWFGKTGDDIPEKMRGIQRVTRTAPCGLVLLDHNSEEFDLQFVSAKLVDCDEISLTVYQIGTRELTREEQDFLDEWSQIKAEFEKKCPWGNLYNKKRAFFDGSRYPYLSGFCISKGRHYNESTGKVVDSQVRGEVAMRYRVHMA